MCDMDMHVRGGDRWRECGGRSGARGGREERWDWRGASGEAGGVSGGGRDGTSHLSSESLQHMTGG